VAQQALCQQCRHRHQHAAGSDIAGGFKLNRRRFQYSDRRRDAIQCSRRGVSHRRLAVDLTAFAFVAYFN